MRRTACLLFCGVLISGAANAVAADKVPPPTGRRIVEKGAKLENLYTRSADIEGGLTEGCAVAPDGSIYFSDIPLGEDKGLIVRFDPASKETTVFAKDSHKTNGLIFDGDGNLWACEGADYGGRCISRWDTKTGERTVVADKFDGKKFNAPNDLCIDAEGRIYFTDPRYLGHEPRELEQRAVYRLEPATGKVIEITHEVSKPNGIAISPDGRRLYVAEHNNGSDDVTQPGAKQGPMKIWMFRLRPDGKVRGEGEVLIDFGDEKGCDGMTVDNAGNLYLTIRSHQRPGVLVLNPRGKEIASIPTGAKDQDPSQPTVGLPSNVEFGKGDEANTLYITVDMSLYRIPLKATGFHRQYGDKAPEKPEAKKPEAKNPAAKEAEKEAAKNAAGK